MVFILAFCRLVADWTSDRHMHTRLPTKRPTAGTIDRALQQHANTLKTGEEKALPTLGGDVSDRGRRCCPDLLHRNVVRSVQVENDSPQQNCKEALPVPGMVV